MDAIIDVNKKAAKKNIFTAESIRLTNKYYDK